MPVPAKPRPYRRFLTSALHTRFVHAAACASLWHLLLSALASDWYSSATAFFYAIFPIGPAGIKALIFTISSLFIFILQIATFRIGSRCTASNWATIRCCLLSYGTYATFFWYLASAWWFCEAFVFTSPPSAELGWIINGGYGAADKLNERPIYLRFFFLFIAILQSTMHLYFDFSSAPIQEMKRTSGAITNNMANLVDFIKKESKRMSTLAVGCSALASLVGPFVYNGLLRSSVWQLHVSIARLFANLARSETNPPGMFYVGGIMMKLFFWGTILSFTWQLNLAIFKHFIVQRPLKNLAPLSASSKDPNGTLLHGLKAKNDMVKTFAFWELDVIATTDLPRRKAIFTDIERPTGRMFSSMLAAGLDVIKSIDSRIAGPPPAQPTTNPQGGPAQDPDVHHLPKILPAAKSTQATIYGRPPAAATFTERFADMAAQEIKQIGSSPNAWQPRTDNIKRLAIEYSSPLKDNLQTQLDTAQQSPLGRYLLESPVRVVKSTILGSPTANPSQILFAINSTTRLLIASLEEDSYGKAVQGVASAVHQLTNTIYAIESFVHKYTNGGVVAASDATYLHDVTEIHNKLKTFLKEILDRFQGFVAGRLSIKDLNDARKAAEPRDLLRVIQKSAAPAQGQSEKSKQSKNSSREMEEVRSGRQEPSREDQHSNQNKGKEREGTGSRRRITQAEEQSKQRPGRLFAQLDEGSEYQRSLRERRKSQSRGEIPFENPLAAGRTSRPEMSENVLGARDFGTMPSGGLQRRTAKA